MVNNLPKTLLKFVLYFIKEHWVSILFIQIFCFAWAIDHTLWPYVLMLVVDTVTNYASDKSEALHLLVKPLALGAVLWISVEISYRVSGFLMATIFPKIEASIRMNMFNYVQKHSYNYFSNNFAGTISNKINDMPLAVGRILQTIITLFFPVVLALMISIAMFAYVQPMFAFILISWVVIHVCVCLLFAKKCDKYSDVHSESRSVLSGKIVDSLTNHINVRLFSRHSFEKEYLKKYQSDEIKKHKDSLIYVEKMKMLLGIICFFGAFVGINGFMIYSWMLDQITAGEVVFIFNTSWNITMMVWLAGLEIPALFKEIGICRQALTIIQAPHDLKDHELSQKMQIKKGEIIFDKVSFRYSKKNQLFNKKSVHINAGEKVGLVGFSGSGKTSFVHLILRYFDVNEGKIIIDGQDIALATQESLRSQIALIPQDPILFHRSLMENIRYSRLDATDEEVIEASKKAHCHDFIQKMPEGYYTLVGERGIKLSGGQRQRIAIARAILKNAPIVILDEATSALDSVTERHIQESLAELMKGKTTLVIAHRLSTLANMDRVLVFAEGKIVEEGTHQELSQANSFYAKMWDMQQGGFLPKDHNEEEESYEEEFEEETNSNPNEDTFWPDLFSVDERRLQSSKKR